MNTIYVTNHALERFKKRGNIKQKVDDKLLSKSIVDSITKWKEHFKTFGGGTVKIGDTGLKALVRQDENDNFAVVTIVTKDMYNGNVPFNSSQHFPDGGKRNKKKNMKEI